MEWPKICVSVPVTATAKAAESMQGLSGPDLIELRLDYSAGRIDLGALRDSVNIPLIATVRVPAHGGRWVRGDGERLELLRSAIGVGFNYLDVEADSTHLDRLVDEAHAAGASVIASRHYLDGTPSLEELLGAHVGARRSGADVVKLVGTAASYADNLPCLEYLRREPGNLCFSMGPMGVPSRVLSPLLGGAFTYASAVEGREVAPGQLTITRLRELYNLMGIDT